MFDNATGFATHYSYDVFSNLRQVTLPDGRVIDSPVALARIRTKLSQAAFASLMGVSKRTLQEWEQGRRKPSKAAQTLLRIAEMHPEVLRELNSTNRPAA